MFLTEQILGTILKTIPDSTSVAQWNLPRTKYRYDYKLVCNSITYFIEFDGYAHFTCPRTISRDVIKDTLLWEHLSDIELLDVPDPDDDLNGFDEYMHSKYKIVRIPYFVQLDTTMLKYYFGDIYINAGYTYPHGFIDKNAKTPDYFCYQGILRYKNILKAIPNRVADIIKFSATNRTAYSIHNRVCVIGEDNPEHYFDVYDPIILYNTTYNIDVVDFNANVVKLPEYSEDLISCIRSYIKFNDSADISNGEALFCWIKQNIPHFESFIRNIK